MMQACDAVVLPSRREPFGIAAAESMALGIPTIVSAVDGLLDLAGDGDAALLVPPDDARALADALWRLHGDPGLRDRLSAAGSRRVRERFSASAAGGAWAKLLKEVA